MPLQIALGVSVLVNCGVGLTVTTTLYVLAFVQPFALTVYTYVTSIGAVVVFVKVSLGLPVPVDAVLLIPATAALLHAYVAPLVLLVGV